MKEENNLKLKLKLSHLRQLWQDFCELHTNLYELTCDEYMHLLSSDIDELELSLNDKKELLDKISVLENDRSELISEICELYQIENPEKLSLLIEVLRDKNEVVLAEELSKRNLVLLDIIEKIQDQNKKNQFFLNKAIYSLKELKDGFAGSPQYRTYSSNGTTKVNKTY